MESPYDGPCKVVDVPIGDHGVKVVVPADPDRLLDDPRVLDWNRRDDYMPYWAYLWPGAFLLANAVAAEPWEGSPSGAVLEIGCGLGLAGLVALHAGIPRVHFTDYDATPLRFVAWSASENGFAPDRYETTTLDWRHLPDATFPVILGADVLYERPLVPLVANLLDRLLAPDGLALLAGPYRVASEDFAGALALWVWIAKSGRSRRGT